ncbi:MAG: hypothetical protein GIW95_12515, partial [Candidatus Eremiobacteraeota bacterium]|nr:hypothetical protein [Candidatus Eremiobacteraeota bacterium]
MAAPTPAPLVRRPALVAELQAIIRGHLLTAVVAAAGYGKTSLARLALTDAPDAIWYVAQPWESAEFAAPLINEIRRLRPDFGRVTLALAVRRPRGAGGAWAQRLGASFGSELHNAGAPLTLVIDDAHFLADDPTFAEFLRGAMRTLPARVRIVLLGRRLPDIPLGEWMAHGDATIVEADRLRFDTMETAALARALDVAVPSHELERIRLQFEGWPAGLALTLSGGNRPIPSAHGTLNAATAYLIEASLRDLPAPLQAFLEATCVYQTLAPDILDRDPQLPDAVRRLRDLQRAGTMLEVLPGNRFRVHSLLRDALLERVNGERGAVALAELNRRAALASEAAHAISPALFHWEHAEDTPGTIRFLRTHAYDLFANGHGERAVQLARKIAATDATAESVRAQLEGMLARQRGEPGAAELFEHALRSGSDAGDERGVLALRALLTEDRLARREPLALAELDDLRSFARDAGPLLESDVRTFAGWAHALRHDYTEARASARAARELAAGDVIRDARGAALEAYAATAAGDFAGADAALNRVLRELEGGEHVVLLANTLAWYARCALLWGDVAAARDYAEQGEALARKLALSAELAGLNLALAEIAGHAGDRTAARDFGAAATRFAASAWYAGDRDRTPRLVELYAARAAYL